MTWRSSPAEFRALKKIHIAACGTSWHTGQVGKFMIEHPERVPVEADHASEWRYRNPVLAPDSDRGHRLRRGSIRSCRDK
jgi:glucosamine 6-phosphate synthetase-like amidotransferase/phosphosugar isomerase protein